MVLVAPARERDPRDVAAGLAVSVQAARDEHAQVAGVVVEPGVHRERAGSHRGAPRAPEHGACLGSSRGVPPALADRGKLMAACRGTLVHGDAALLERECSGLVVAAMSMPHVIDRLVEGSSSSSSRLTARMCCSGSCSRTQSTTLPSLSGVISSTGASRPSPQVERLVARLGIRLPMVATGGDTMATVTALGPVEGRITLPSERKVRAAVALVEDAGDLGAVAGGDKVAEGAVTPLMFEHDVVERARAASAHLVLPEGAEERILHGGRADHRTRHRPPDPARRRGGGARHGETARRRRLGRQRRRPGDEPAA